MMKAYLSAVRTFVSTLQSFQIERIPSRCFIKIPFLIWDDSTLLYIQCSSGTLITIKNLYFDLGRRQGVFGQKTALDRLNRIPPITSSG